MEPFFDADPPLCDLSQKQLIIKSATDCFERLGYFETSFSDIADEAGVSFECISTTYQSKDQILADYIKQYDEYLGNLFDSIDDSMEPDLSKIYKICMISLIYLRTHKVITAIWFEFYRHHVARVVLRSFFSQIRRRILEAVQQGIARKTIKNLNAKDVVETIIALFEGTLIISRLEEDEHFEERFKCSWSTLVAGLEQ